MQNIFIRSALHYHARAIWAGDTDSLLIFCTACRDRQCLLRWFEMPTMGLEAISAHARCRRGIGRKMPLLYATVSLVKRYAIKRHD